MRLEIENVGKIRKAAIDFNGLTVIAGENNTGKSTVGKMLYCLFDAFYKIEEQIDQERQKSIENLIYNYSYASGVKRIEINRIVLRNTAQDIMNIRGENKDNISAVKLSLYDILKNYYINDEDRLPHFVNQEFLEQLAGKIQDVLNVTDDEIRTLILEKRFGAEFGMKVGHLNNPQMLSRTRLNIKEQEITVEVINNSTFPAQIFK